MFNLCKNEKISIQVSISKYRNDIKSVLEIISQTTNQSDQACGHAQNSQDFQPNKVQDSDTSHRI